MDRWENTKWSTSAAWKPSYPSLPLRHTYSLSSRTLCPPWQPFPTSTPHSLATRIHTLLITLSIVSQFITFIWVSSNRRIPGNEIVDSAVKTATNLSHTNFRILAYKIQSHPFYSTTNHQPLNLPLAKTSPSNKLSEIKYIFLISLIWPVVSKTNSISNLQK